MLNNITLYTLYHLCGIYRSVLNLNNTPVFSISFKNIIVTFVANKNFGCLLVHITVLRFCILDRIIACTGKSRNACIDDAVNVVP